MKKVNKNIVKLKFPTLTINLEDFVMHDGETIVWKAKNYYTDTDYSNGKYTPIEQGIINKLEDYIYYHVAKDNLIRESYESQSIDILDKVKKLLVDSGDIEED